MVNEITNQFTNQFTNFSVSSHKNVLYNSAAIWIKYYHWQTLVFFPLVSKLIKSYNSPDSIKPQKSWCCLQFGSLNLLYYNLYGIRGFFNLKVLACLNVQVRFQSIQIQCKSSGINHLTAQACYVTACLTPSLIAKFIHEYILATST